MNINEVHNLHAYACLYTCVCTWLFMYIRVHISTYRFSFFTSECEGPAREDVPLWGIDSAGRQVEAVLAASPQLVRTKVTSMGPYGLVWPVLEPGSYSQSWNCTKS